MNALDDLRRTVRAATPDWTTSEAEIDGRANALYLALRAHILAEADRGAIRPDNLRMLPATFFEPGRSYASGTWRFRCEAVTPSPSTGETRALGWKYGPVHDVHGWHAAALDPDDWAHGGWTDTTTTSTGDHA